MCDARSRIPLMPKCPGLPVFNTFASRPSPLSRICRVRLLARAPVRQRQGPRRRSQAAARQLRRRGLQCRSLVWGGFADDQRPRPPRKLRDRISSRSWSTPQRAGPVGQGPRAIAQAGFRIRANPDVLPTVLGRLNIKRLPKASEPRLSAAKSEMPRSALSRPPAHFQDNRSPPSDSCGSFLLSN